MKIYLTTGTFIDCEPTQEAIELEGVDTFNKKLVIKDGKGFLVPTVLKLGDCLQHSDNYIPITLKKFNLFNIFKWKELRIYIHQLEHNYVIARLKESASTHKMVIQNHD